MIGFIPQSELYPNVSVVVPYFGTSQSDLLTCLRCLECQQYPAQNLEILVVDNSPTPFLRIDLLGTDRVSILHEPVPGSYAARNRGILSSTGSIVAFTDADCAPTPTWLNNAIRELAQFQFNAAIGGKIVFTFHDAANPNIWELYDSIIHLRQEDYVNNNKFAATANLISPRHHFAQVGNFNQKFYSGGDRDWGERLNSRGVPIIYSRTAVVRHRARSTANELILKNRRGVGAESIRVQIDGAPTRRILWTQLGMFIPRFRLLANAVKMNAYGTCTLCKLSLICILIHIARCFEAIRLMSGGIPLRL